MPSETKQVGSVFVTKTRILGTKSLFVFAAYEASSYFGRHSSLFTIDGQACGSLPSRRLPGEIDALPPATRERCQAVDAFHAKNYEEAYAAILAAFPEAAEGKRQMGDIEVGSW